MCVSPSSSLCNVLLISCRTCVAGDGAKLEVKGLFYGIGHQPNSQLVAGQIDLDDHGYVKVLPCDQQGLLAILQLTQTGLMLLQPHCNLSVRGNPEPST